MRVHVRLPADGLVGVENTGLGSLVVNTGFKTKPAGQGQGTCGQGGQAQASFSVVNRGIGRLLVMGIASDSVAIENTG